MDMLLVLFIICAFVGQLIAGAVIVLRYKSKGKKKISAAAFQPIEVSGEDFFDGKKYFFESNIKRSPLYSLSGEIMQFAMDIPSSEALSCDAEEIAKLISRIDPAESGFDFKIADGRTGKAARFLCDTPDFIKVDLSVRDSDIFYSGRLVFPMDMKVILFDYFAGYEVVNGFSLKAERH
ncbi:MAG: hypothetical protein ACYC5K_11155 [Saccharofermentanales bacterium]